MPSSPHHDVLVTGSSGHLGRALMLHLPTLGLNPLGIDIVPSPTTHATGSISDRAFVASIMSSNGHIKHVIHAAALHKPHIETHTTQDFIDTNISGTQILLDACPDDIESFVLVSTTSAFGASLSPEPGEPAAWIDESVRPTPRNIYGVTKCAAEDLALLAHRGSRRLPVVILRTSRFFPEDDDDPARRAALSSDNLKVLELAYRRCDLADIVDACHRAAVRARHVAGRRFVVSAPTPFTADPRTLRLLMDEPETAYADAVPGVVDVFRDRGWGFLPRVDRVYDSAAAVRELGWNPTWTFPEVVRRLSRGEEWRSDLAVRVGSVGYHAYTAGVYTKR